MLGMQFYVGVAEVLNVTMNIERNISCPEIVPIIYR